MPSPPSPRDVTSLAQVTAHRLRRRSGPRAAWIPTKIPVTVAPSWALGLGLTAWTVGDALLPDAVPDRSIAAYAAGAVGTAAVLALTLAFHETAHALAAARAGLGVRGMTLSFFGGALELAEPPATPGVELSVAIAGPLASAAAAVVATAAHVGLVFADADPLLAASSAVVAVGNLLAAAFNCIPAVPLDGGHALHAAVWAVTGREETARRVTTATGGALGVGLIGLAVVASASADAALAVWLGLLGVSVYSG